MLKGRVSMRRWAAAALSGATVVGTVSLVGAGTAWAAAGTYAGAEAPTTINEGATNQAASNWLIQLQNNFTSATTVTFQVKPPAGTNCAATGQNIGFHTTPTVSVLGAESSSGGAADPSDTPPSIIVSLSSSAGNCTSQGVKDILTLRVTNSATGTNSDEYELQVSAVAYDVGAASGTGNVFVSFNGGAFNNTSGTATLAGLANVPMTGSGNLSNATITNVVVSEAPPVGVGEGTTGNALSTFVLNETVPAAINAIGGVVSALNPDNGSFTGTATVSATGFTVAVLGSDGVTCPASGSSSVSVPAGTSSSSSYGGLYNGQYPFCLYGQTTSTPGSVTVSGITYSAPTSAGAQNVTLTVNGTPYATAPPAQPPITVVYTPRIAGVSADDTAAQAAEATMNNTTIASNCGLPPGGAVIVASDAEYQDALSASFLGHADLHSQQIGGNGTNPNNGGCNNPILLNPPTPPPGGESTTAAAAAIRKLGASTVYLIGGTAALSPDVATQLGQIQIGTFSSGAPQYLQVIRIAGFTAEQTAADVAQYPATCRNGTAINSCDAHTATPGAYGLYNSGASESASGPSSSVPTAILADSGEFQDALAASPLAYSAVLPVLLTGAGSLDPSAQSAIVNMGIKQVIVVGGSAAVSDAVVSTLQSMGVSVLRIAGTTFDATSVELADFIVNEDAPPTAPHPGLNAGLDSEADSDPTGIDYSGNSGPPILTVGIARGDSFQDALTSAQVLGWISYGGTGADGPEPLLLNSGPSTPGPAVAAFLGANGTAPAGGFLECEDSSCTSQETHHVLGLDVFGGTLAQTPGLVQGELNDIAAG